MSNHLLIVSAREFLIPLIYLKEILKGEIAMAQVLTFEFKVF